MKKIAGLLLSILFAITAGYTKDNTLDDARSFFDAENYKAALPLYLELYKEDSTDIEFNLSIGICYLNASFHRAKSLAYLEDAAFTPDSVPEAYYYLGRAYHIANDFTAAREAYITFERLIGEKGNEELLKEIDREIETLENAIHFFNNKGSEKVVNLGNTINSKYSEYSPLISEDQKTIIFTYVGEGCKGGKRNYYGQVDSNGFYMEDIYISTLNDNTWSKPQSIGDEINTELPEATTGLTPDGKTLFFYKSDSKSPDDIWMSTFDGSSWSTPEQLPSPINTKYFEAHACISNDGNTIYFSSDRPGGFGGKDIYVSQKKDDGGWTNPKNLGKSINTQYDEEGPFMHSPTNTLYFSSYGHNSMGGLDIFKSKGKNGVFEKAENMGFPVNTTDDDPYFVLSQDGEIGYLSSERVRHCYGQQDLYKVYMNKIHKEDTAQIAILKGKISIDGAPIEATITIKDNVTSEIIATIKSNPKTGKYVVSLPSGKTYELIAKPQGKEEQSKTINLESKKGFNLVTSNFEFGEKKEEGELSIVKGNVLIENKPGKADITVVDEETSKMIAKETSDETDGSYVLSLFSGNSYKITAEAKGYEKTEKIIDIANDDNFNLHVLNFSFNKNKNKPSVSEQLGVVVFFDFDASDLEYDNEKGKRRLDDLIQKIKTLDQFSIELFGHTDSKGNAAYNKTLSENRIKAVREYMLANGVDEANILKSVGYGSSVPKANNDTEAGRALNRRVEVKIIKE